MNLRRLNHWLVDHWLWLLLGLLVLAGALWWWWSKTHARSAKQTFETPKVETIERTISASGIIRADKIARLRFLAGGKVTYVGAKDGDIVKKGQTLAVIDRSTLEKQLQQNLNTYERERYDWEGYQESIKDKASTTALERSTKSNQLSLNDTVLSVEIQNIAIRNTVLSAPFTGIITVAPTAVAGVQLTGADYYEVVDPDSLEFIARIDEADIAKIQEGQNASIVLDAFRDTPIDSQIAKIAFNSVETGSGTQYEIQLPLTGAAVRNQLRLGMNGDVTIKLGKSENALTIPLLATRTRNGKTYVDIKLADGKLQERQIETGIETDQRIEVVSGLNQTDQILVPE